MLSIKYISDFYNYYLSSTETIEQWVANAPPGEKRQIVADKIQAACSTGALKLGYSIMNGISTLPALPKEIKSIKIKGADKLHTLPLHSEVRTVKIEDCPDLDVRDLPAELHKLSVENVKSISTLPQGLKHLTIKYQALPILPCFLSTLKVERSNGLLDMADLANLKKVEISYCPNVEISSFPSNAEFINITGGILNKKNIPSLPTGLLELSISNDLELTTIPELPDSLRNIKLINLCKITKLTNKLSDNLESLEIYGCPHFTLPTELPKALSKINLHFYEETNWNIPAEKIPSGADIRILGVVIDPDCYKRQDITFGKMYTESSLCFKAGDVLYGLSTGRANIKKIITKLSNYTAKDIIIQNTLTDAVWNRYRYWEFNSENHISDQLNDKGRGIAFREFMAKHERYNVTDDKFSKLDDTQRWTKTSKAGLEFQTKVRERKVIFCADELIDAIPDIASKGGAYGDAITAHELRWLYRHRNEDYIKNNVVFSLKGKIVSHDTIFSLKDWEIYQPKNQNK